MSVRVAIPGVWRGLTGSRAWVECEGATVLAVLQDLTFRHPQMTERLFTPEGEPKPFVQVFLNKKRTEDLTVPVHDGDEILLLMAIAGG
jgi:molybdopterin converting factor small subunit